MLPLSICLSEFSTGPKQRARGQAPTGSLPLSQQSACAQAWFANESAIKSMEITSQACGESPAFQFARIDRYLELRCILKTNQRTPVQILLHVANFIENTSEGIAATQDQVVPACYILGSASALSSCMMLLTWCLHPPLPGPCYFLMHVRLRSDALLSFVPCSQVRILDDRCHT